MYYATISTLLKRIKAVIAVDIHIALYVNNELMNCFTVA